MQPIAQSAVVPFREKDGHLEFALITSRNTGRWIVPKGLVENNMTPWASAAKEALEEAGLLGAVGEKPIGQFIYTKLDKIFHVDIYPLRVTEALDDWDEKRVRRRKWANAEDAIDQVNEQAVKDAIAYLSNLKDWPNHLP